MSQQQQARQTPRMKPCLEVGVAVYSPGCEERVLLGTRLRLLAARSEPGCRAIEIHSSSPDVTHDRMLFYMIEWESEHHLAQFVTSEHSMKNFSVFLPYLVPDSFDMTRWTRHLNDAFGPRNIIDSKREEERVLEAFTVTIIVKSKPNKSQEYATLLMTMKAYTQQEEGCVKFNILAGMEESRQDHFLIYGVFKSEQSYKEHSSRRYSLFSYDALNLTDGSPRLMSWRRMDPYK
jgi:quinol monooxygenase YgiN